MTAILQTFISFYNAGAGKKKTIVNAIGFTPDECELSLLSFVWIVGLVTVLMVIYWPVFFLLLSQGGPVIARTDGDKKFKGVTSCVFCSLRQHLRLQVGRAGLTTCRRLHLGMQESTSSTQPVVFV